MAPPPRPTGRPGEPAVVAQLTSGGESAFGALTAELSRRGSRRGGGAEAFQHLALVLDDRILALPFIDYRAAPGGIDGSEGVQIPGRFDAAGGAQSRGDPERGAASRRALRARRLTPFEGRRSAPDTVNPVVNDPFKALSHPIRRGIVERLAAGPATVGDATGGFGVSKPAISKHLKVLEETGVVRREIAGRTHRLSLEPDVLSEAADWMDRQRALWGRLFDVVDDYLKEEASR